MGEFVLRELLGEGGFGAIYRAEQPKLSREAVVKVLHARHARAGNAVQRFLREVRIASRLDHPYAAHIYAFGAESDGTLWIAMEHVRGLSLGQLLKRQGPVPLARLVPLFEQICEVVQAAHDQGIVHRDLKPANVMVVSRSGRMRPKLLDFGIAKVLQAEGPGEERLERPAAVAPMPRGAASSGVTPSSEREGTEPSTPPTPSDSDEPTPAVPVSATGEKSVEEVLSGLEDPTSWSKIETDELTEYGVIIGTPGYMAPELWTNSAAIGPAVDVYALGIMFHECLTGTRPFRGGRQQVAAAHRTEQLPAIQGVPEAVGRVLAKATHKLAGQRYETAAQLGAALRAASGIDEEQPELPRLVERVREESLACAPQPIADSVAALDSARSPREALGGVRAVVWASLRYLVALGLAIRCRVASDAAEPDVLGELLAKLQRGELSDSEWPELLEAICRPFAGVRRAWPLPELLSFGLELDQTPLRSLMRQLSRLSDASESEVRLALGSLVEQLGQLLQQLRFLQEYRLVFAGPRGLSGWMGVRRHWRAGITSTASVAEGHLGLLNRDGELVVDLWPLAQVHAPSPGLEPECFLLESSGRFGAKLSSWPSGFEHHDERLWSWLSERIPVTGASALEERDSERPPYLGLASFSAGDAGNYFGREREAEAFVNRLKVQSLLAVVGPSGAGKSSFLQAGVLPRLPSHWRPLNVRPGPTPVATLLSRLEAEGQDVTHLREALHADQDALGECLREHAARTGQTLLLIVDQFEELLTLCSDPGEQRLYAEALVRAAGEPEGAVKVVFALRDDFLIRIQQLPPLRDHLTQGLQLLGTPAAEDLLRILVEPARRRGHDFEDPKLPERMVAEVAALPGALALLSFTASQLWALRDRHFRRLTNRSYEALGGVGGALAHHAESVLAGLSAAEAKLVREAMRHLVTSQGTRAVLTRRELVELLGDSRAGQKVIEDLVRARLLVTREDESESDRIEVIHEALLASWPRLVGWLREDAEGARFRDQLRAAARQWDARGRPRGMLWRGEVLVEYRLWSARHDWALTSAESAFVRASLAEELAARRVRYGLLIAAFVAAVGSSVVLYRSNARAQVARAEAQRNETKANQRLLRLFEEQGRQAVLAGDSLSALTFLNEAFQAGLRTPELSFLLARAHRRASTLRLTLRGHHDRVWDLAYNPSGTRLASAGGDGSVRVWDARTGRLLLDLRGHSKRVKTVTFSADGQRLATGGSDAQVVLWSVEGGQRLLTLQHPATVNDSAFDLGGRRLVTVGADAKVRIWDLERGVLLEERAEHAGPLVKVELSPDGSRFATAGIDRVVRLWDWRGALLASLAGHEEAVEHVEFSADGQLLVAATGRGARIWDLRRARQVAMLGGHSSEVMWASFSPDGQRVVTASMDRTAKVWDVRTGRMLHNLAGHQGFVVVARFSPDGKSILTAGSEGTSHLWKADSGQHVWSLVGHEDSVWRATFSPNGTEIATGAFDNTVRVWDATRSEVSQVYDGGKGAVWSVTVDRHGDRVLTGSASSYAWDARTGAKIGSALVDSVSPSPFLMFSPDERRVLASDGNAIRVIEIDSRQTRLTLRGHEGAVHRGRYSPDGALIATSSEDHTARLWSASTGELVRTLKGHTKMVWCVAFSPDGKLLATTSEDHTAALWRVATGERLHVLRGHALAVYGCSFSIDGTKLVTAGEDKSIKVWDVARGTLTSDIKGHAQAVMDVAYSPDGALLASGSIDRTLKVWSASTGKLLWSAERHGDTVTAVQFSADGRAIYTASMDGRALAWELGTPDLEPASLQRFVDCHSPMQLEGEILKPRTKMVDGCAADRR